MCKIALTAVATAVVCFAIAAATGLGAGTRSAAQIQVIGNNYVYFSGIDMSCQLYASDPDHHEAGPVLVCFRNSTAGKHTNGAEVSISRFHMKLSAPGSNRWNYTVARTP
jgi:hypothetical protein